MAHSIFLGGREGKKPRFHLFVVKFCLTRFCGLAPPLSRGRGKKKKRKGEREPPVELARNASLYKERKKKKKKGEQPSPAIGFFPNEGGKSTGNPTFFFFGKEDLNVQGKTQTNPAERPRPTPSRKNGSKRWLSRFRLTLLGLGAGVVSEEKKTMGEV